MTDIGELVIGAWLAEVKAYDIVLYNRRPGRDLPADVAPPGLAGVSARLSELDVVGMNTVGRRTYLAESTMHLEGMLIGRGYRDAQDKLEAKFRVAKAYGDILETRTGFAPELAFWSPKVSKSIAALEPDIERAVGSPIEFVVNDTYADRVNEIIECAASETRVSGNDFYRSVQLLTHLAKAPILELPKRVQRRINEAVAELLPDVAPVVDWRFVNRVHPTQRGIYAPRAKTIASVICNTGKDAPYPDRFLAPDVLRYVGWGPTGDQAVERDNESLRLAIERGIQVRVFEKTIKNRYLDHGYWIGVGSPDFVIEPEIGRRLVVFMLRRVSAIHAAAKGAS